MGCGKMNGIADHDKQEKWLVEQLRKYKAWIVLMPYNEFSKPNSPDLTIVEHLSNNPEWERVYVSHKQVIYVDMTTEKGQNLVQGIMAGTVVYPDEHLKNNILSYYLYNEADTEEAQLKAELEGLEKAEIEDLKNTEIVKRKEAAILEKRKKAFALALSSFEEYTSMSSLNLVSRSLTFVGVRRDTYAEMRRNTYAFMEQYVEDFEANQKKYSKKDGYLHRINSATVMAERLIYVLTSEENKLKYKNLTEDWTSEMITKRDSKRW